jgi:hypothetical protein
MGTAAPIQDEVVDAGAELPLGDEGDAATSALEGVPASGEAAFAPATTSDEVVFAAFAGEVVGVLPPLKSVTYQPEPFN